MRLNRLPLEVFVLGYLLLWIPYIGLNRGLSITTQAGLGHAMSGLQLLPLSLISITVFTYGFIWLGGWWRTSPVMRLGPLRIPRPTPWTALSGLGSGLMLVAVPLSYTFAGVSIPFVQLLMRGDVLLIAPIIDLLSRRRVRWFSWVALALVAVGLALTIRQRGGLHLPPLCWATIGVYTAGYFLRLSMMTKVGKTGEMDDVKRYFVQEQMVAAPAALVALAVLGGSALGAQSREIGSGFIGLWGSPAFIWIVGIGFLAFVISILATLILLDRRENTYCVPLERSASVLGGMAAAYVLAWIYSLPAPTGAELIGAALLVCAIVLLALAPRLGRRAGAKSELARVPPR